MMSIHLYIIIQQIVINEAREKYVGFFLMVNSKPIFRGGDDDMLKIINLLLCRCITMHRASFISFSFSVGVLTIITRGANLY